MFATFARSQDPAVYLVKPQTPETTREDDQTILAALNILTRRIKKPLAYFGDVQSIKQYLMLRYVGMDYEVFSVLFLNAQNQLITHEDMFRGTLTQTSVYPREVVVAALKHSAAAVVLCHNHPSGDAKPSRADECLTQTLKAALCLVDVRVLDHFIVGSTETLSMAERGLL